MRGELDKSSLCYKAVEMLDVIVRICFRER